MGFHKPKEETPPRVKMGELDFPVEYIGKGNV